MNVTWVRRRARFGVFAALVGVLAVAIAQGDAAGEDSDDDERAVELLQTARARVADAEFSGTVQVEWSDGAGLHTAQVEVRGASGTIDVAANRAFARTLDGGLRQDDDGWVALGSSESLDVVPTPSAKYRLTTEPGPIVAGRTTTVIDAVLPADSLLVERIYVDDATGLMLRRERYANDGSTVLRAVSFIEFTPGAVHVDSHEVAASPVRARRRLSGVYRDPESAGDGFELLSRGIDPDGNAHLLYGDGLLTVSVFEQPGRLDWDSLPEGGVATRIDGVAARRYELPVGSAYVWERGEVVYTAVSDAPESQILAVAESVSSDREQGRLARLARTVLDPFVL